MSNTSLETSGPYARIAVHAPAEESPFLFSTETTSRVEVETYGTIRIHWQKEDQQAQLDFTLTSSPDNSFFNGFLLGWHGPDIPADGPQPLSYSVEAPLMEGGQAVLRTLVVKLVPGQGTYTYLLCVANPTNGTIGKVDPKIYNEGDGGGGGGHR